MKTFYVYILLCNDGSYYTGITNNLERRLYEHYEGIDNKCYTYHRRPLLLKFYAEFTNPEEAIAFEKKIKGWSRKKKEALIENNWSKVRELSKCINETSSKNMFAHPSTTAQDDKCYRSG